MTNFDVIKQMTVAELGEFLNKVDCVNCAYFGKCSDGMNCQEGITEWLGQESSRWMSDYIKENNL